MTPSEILELHAYAEVVLRERDQFGRCGSKMAYATKMQAERGIRRKAKRAGVVAYRCACGQWRMVFRAGGPGD